jgi:tRNA dimethylallyltransferase
MTPLPPLVVLTGPTAVGKTALSITLCQRFNGEVVSADSRQIYRGMDIGTAKPTPAEQAAAPHHLLDLREPDQSLSLAEYQELAYATIDDIHRRGKLPLLVGGSALYVRGVVQGLRIPDVPPNPALRGELEAFAAQHGHEALFARLQAVDPDSAARMDGRNVRRVVRALEIFLESGQPKSALEGASPPPYRILQIGLDRARANLYARIGQRVAQMIQDGLIHETQRLLAAGYAPTLPAMTSLGYKEIGQYLAGNLILAEAVERIEIETHRFVRHQYSWFRRMEGIHWINGDQPHAQEVLGMVAQFVDSAPSL